MPELASFALGPGLGYLFANSAQGIRLMMLVTAGIMFPAAIMRYYWLHDMTDHQAGGINIKQVIGSFNKNLVICLFVYVFFTFLVNTTIYGPFITLFARDQMGLGQQAIQLLFLWGGVAGILLTLYAGHAAQKIGSRWAMAAGCIGHALFLIPWMFSRNLASASILYMFSYVFLQMSIIAHDTIIAEITKPETRSSVIGFTNTVAGLLGALIPRTGMMLYLAASPGAPFYMALGFALLTSIYTFMIKTETS